jgi:spore coat protein A
VALDQILLAPAERADVIVHFSDLDGEKITITNDANAPFPDGDPVDEHTASVMQFRVSLPLLAPDTSVLPARLRAVPRIPEASATVVRSMGLREQKDEDEEPILVIIDGKDWDDPVSETPHLGTSEVWRLINATGDAHPMHLHLVQFQVLDRQPFDVETYLANGELVFTEPAVPPDPNELGWKDTVRANPGEVTRIIARFDDYAGRYVWHCHILEHEDNEMMRPYDVVAAP